MPAREYRAYDGTGTPRNYFKDVEGEGTLADPDRSLVKIVSKEATGGITGNATSGQNKDGNILETLHFIANNFPKSPIFAVRVPIVTISVSTTLTTILDINCSEHLNLALRFHNIGGAALNDLQIQAFESVDFPNDFQLIAGSGVTSSYSTTGIKSGNSLMPIAESNGTLPALPANGKANVLINIRFFQRILIRASVATGTTNLVAAGILKR